ncbi:cryptochrome/photolyase family protein [Sediminitomix flava]|uniref:Deoxyribodipyrimidine photolyase-related protein n=1 Tax=Sediminitomix flava TaxID=379075 RepID=A0A315ZZT2_SEDFL|nr:cryptochrome/photolyase family protein [Sediminitomix flava]PWJ42887.1 deoxyribodipyrimidine photolyase-related protein [Sediminitomix flava]
MSKAINLVFPHQLFQESPLLKNGNVIYLIEEFLFFRQYSFHKQKLAFHRASMKAYQSYLEKKGINIVYIEAHEKRSDIRVLLSELTDVSEIHILNPVDDWLEKRIQKCSQGKKIVFYDNPSFLNTEEELSAFFRADKKSFFQTTFYKQERKKRGILIDDTQNPVGGKWTYDQDNRKKYPKGKTPPAVEFPKTSELWKDAVNYIQKHFDNNLGKLTDSPLYPLTFQESQNWLKQFLATRFHEFGIYEDAIVKDESTLNHSILSPLINTGLILPQDIIEQSLAYAETNEIPLNSTEGFIRQIIGWREFIRGMYICKGVESRTKNYWGFSRKIPQSFYDATTGIAPIDHTIKKVLETGYCHHIERLMILGNFMLLCEFDPNEVYRWFMELFIDAYDWVMVPNVYGMSQFADGGLFATKPYIGGSNYIRKMSDYPKGDWEPIWDGLFWRFIHHHQEVFSKNQRMSMLYHSLLRMDEGKRAIHLQNAEAFLNSLDQ